MEKQKNLSTKNSLIELYRFIFAIWVMYYHGYFLTPANHLFQKGYLSVEFFFILTGFFLVNLYKTQNEKPLLKGCIHVGYKKLKPLGLTLIITLSLAFIHFAVFYHDFSFGYMWYIKWFFIMSIFYFIIYKLSSRHTKIFYWLIFACIAIINIYNHYSINISGSGLYRSVVAIAIGILISAIPKNNWKIKNFNINIIFASFIFLTSLILACFNYLYNLDWLFIYILFPSLIYFTSCINFSCHFLNYLGKLSFGLYGYQTVCRILEDSGILNRFTNTYIMTLIIFGCTICDDLLKRLIAHIKNKKYYKNTYLQKTR